MYSEDMANSLTLGERPVASPSSVEVPACAPAAPRLRVGGMAFGNGVLMRSKHAWAWARSDGTVLHGPVLSLLDRSRWLRLPLVRSLVALAEMLAFAIRLQRRNGIAPNLRLLGWLALWVCVSSWLSSLASGFITNTLLADFVSQVASILLGLLALQRGMGAEIWRYHGAEHKAVNAYEAGADLADLKAVATFSCIHDRCGSNLVAILLMLSLVYLPQSQRLTGGAFSALYSLCAIALAFELFRLVTQRPQLPICRVVLCPGKTLQRCLTTREPQREQLKVACRALRRVVALEDQRQAAALGLAPSVADSLPEG
jgi:uncharacterized protein YqhQ